MHAGLRWRRLVVLAGTVAVAAMTSLVLPGIASAWSWPVDGAVLRPFSLGSDPYAGGQHRGIDVAGADGEGARAPSDGSVTFAGTVPASGRTVSILTADGYSVTLSHLGTIQVSKGDPVREGSVIATVGRSGTSEHTEAYLHLGVRVATQDQGYVDPLGLLPVRAFDQPAAGEPAAVPEPAPAQEPVAAAGAVDAAPTPEPATDGPSPVLVAAPTRVDTPGSIVPAQPADEKHGPEQPSGSSSAATSVADGPAPTSAVSGSSSLTAQGPRPDVGGDHRSGEQRWDERRLGNPSHLPGRLQHRRLAPRARRSGLRPAASSPQRPMPSRLVASRRGHPRPRMARSAFPSSDSR